MRRAILTSLLLMQLGAERAQAKAQFKKESLKVPGTILAYATGDLDGDARTDLVVSYRRGKGPGTERFFAVFFRGELGYSGAPNLTLRAPSNAAVWDLGDVLGGPGEELVYLTTAGVYAIDLHARSAAEPERVVRGRPLVGRAEEEDLITWDFVRRLEPNGPVTVIVPKPGPLELHQRSATGLEPWSRIDVSPPSFYDAERTTYRRSTRGGSAGHAFAYRVTTVIPALWFVDADADGRADLITTYEDRVQIYPRREDGRLSESPVTRRWFRVRTPEEEKRVDNEVTAQVLDVNGDRRADVVITKIGGGITTLRTETFIFLGQADGAFSKAPSQVFREDGFSTLVRFVDVDGDGRLEMLHPKTEVSILAMTRALMSSELSMDLRLRRPSKEKSEVFQGKPTQSLDLLLGLDFKLGGAIRGAYPLAGHDFDGDGKLDIVVPRGASAMGLHHGTGQGGVLFESSPTITLSGPATQHTLVVYATAQERRPDILMFHTDVPELEGEITLLRNVSSPP